ncbi:protein ELYS-like [Cuculus canorus]|uniref:protein ELYS-like n=1 Tax=Cuculus canorus TaxID=55661 RepID=UPI0023AAB7A9|nr:protein ELYS-like [Cuculus canorus]
MRDVRAQVTSSLLEFPEGTLQALGKDEVTQGAVLRGKFTGAIGDLAWLARGPHLEIVSSVTGQRFSENHFRGGHEQPPTIRVVKEFSWEKRAGLLIALEEGEGSVLCLYDLETAEVVKAVFLPSRVIAVEPIINHGGPSESIQHLHQSLQCLFGIAAVATDVGHLFLVDLCLDSMSCSLSEVEVLDLRFVTTTFADEVPPRRETATREGRHLCFRLPSPSGTPISTLAYISRSNQLVVGFSHGCLSLWNMKTLKREQHCRLGGRRIPIYAVTFQEPENDPSNCCYLWAVKSTQESKGDVLSLHLLQLTFGDRKRLASGQVMYEGLKHCTERFSLDLASGNLPWGRQNSNIELLRCQTIEDFYDDVDKEDNGNEVTSPYTSISIFCWQVNTHGQEKTAAYLGVFDINRWYDAEMPDSIRPEKFLLDCPYFALWTLEKVTSTVPPEPILDVLVHGTSLTWGAPPSYLPPDQILNASGYNFGMYFTAFNSEKIKLSSDAIFWFSHSMFSLKTQTKPEHPKPHKPSLDDVEEQLEAILSAAVQTGSLELLTGCIKHWTSEKQPNSAAKLQFIRDCAWKKVVYTKDEFDHICVPLFDGSSRFLDPEKRQSLQHCQDLLDNLSRVLSCFQREPQELTDKDVRNQQVLANNFSMYARMVLWFCQSGLLPEGSDGTTHLSTPSYHYPLLQTHYTGERQRLQHLSRGKCNSDCLMIDGIVSYVGDQLEKLWKKEKGGTGKYPPPSLHALLDLYLLESTEEPYKHAITIYLLLDVFQRFPKQIENIVQSFATTFSLPQGLVALIKGFWFLDHHDYEKSLAHLCHQETTQVAPWLQLRIIQSLACQGQHRQALQYLPCMKPSLSTCSKVRLYLGVLLSNRCMVEAWALLQQHVTDSNRAELLEHVYKSCHEMGLVEELLQLPFTNTELESLKSFLRTRACIASNKVLPVSTRKSAYYWPAVLQNQSTKVNLKNDGDPQTREGKAPQNSGKVLPGIQRKLSVAKFKPYEFLTSSFKQVSTPKLQPTRVKAAKVIPHSRATVIYKILSALETHR